MQPRFHFLRHQFANGLRVLISENQRLPLVSLNAFVIAGAAQNPLDRPGLAALCARLLDEGTRDYSGLEIAELVEGVGGGHTTFSQREISGVSLNLAKTETQSGFQLLSQLIRHPVFPKRSFLREREKVLNQLRALADDPAVVASDMLSRCIYSGTPLQYPNYGTLHSVRKMVRQDVVKFHNRFFSPDNTIIIAVGDLRSEDVLEAIERHLGDWANSSYRRDTLTPLQRQSEPAFRELAMEREQIHILFGHLGIPRNHPDFHALQVMDIVLGNGPGFTSRIPRRLRDEQGLAYTTYCDLCSSSGLNPGRFVAYISTSPENRALAEDGLLGEIRGIQKELIESEELATAQDFLTGSFVFDFQSNADLSRFLIRTELFDLGPDYPVIYPKLIRAVTADKVLEVARRHLDTLNYSRIIVGPMYVKS